jgi:pblB
MLRNSRADDGLKYWTEPNGKMSFTAHNYYFNGQKRMFLLSSGASVHSPRFIIKQNTNYMLNLTAFDANTERVKITFCKRRKGSINDFDEKQIIFDKTGSPAFNSDRAIKKSFSFNTGAFDEGYLLFNYQGNPNGWSGLFMTELDFYEGSADRLWQPSPDDSAEPIEAVRTQVNQLAGSWSVKNLSRAGDVLNSINVLADGTNRIDGRLTHITGQTKIDNAVIKDGMIANLNADKITGGTIDASKINVIHIDASQINAGVMQNMTMRGGRIESLNGRMNIDLQNGQINILDNGAGLTRQGTNLPTQILRMIDDTQITNTGKKYSTLTVLGSTRDKNALTHVSGFAGMRVYNRDETLTELVGDQVIVYTNNDYRSPWIFKAGTRNDHHRLIPSNDNGQKHSIGRSDKPLHELHVTEIYLNGVRLQMALKDMLNRMGYVGTGRWGDRIN